MAPRIPPGKVRLTITLTLAEAAELRHLSAELGITTGAIVGQLLQSYRVAHRSRQTTIDDPRQLRLDGALSYRPGWPGARLIALDRTPADRPHSASHDERRG